MDVGIIRGNCNRWSSFNPKYRKKHLFQHTQCYLTFLSCFILLCLSSHQIILDNAHLGYPVCNTVKESMSPWWTKVSGASLQLKPSLHISLQLPDRASAWTPKSLGHLVGLGYEVLRIINSCLELFYSLSLKEPNSFKAGAETLVFSAGISNSREFRRLKDFGKRG